MARPESQGKSRLHTLLNTPWSSEHPCLRSNKMTQFPRLLLVLLLFGGVVGTHALARLSKAMLAGAQVTIKNSWAAETNLPLALQEVAVTALDGQVYVVGGTDRLGRVNYVLVFDPPSHSWATRAP